MFFVFRQGLPNLSFFLLLKSGEHITKFIVSKLPEFFWIKTRNLFYDFILQIRLEYQIKRYTTLVAVVSCDCVCSNVYLGLKLQKQFWFFKKMPFYIQMKMEFIQEEQHSTRKKLIIGFLRRGKNTLISLGRTLSLA